MTSPESPTGYPDPPPDSPGPAAAAAAPTPGSAGLAAAAAAPAPGAAGPATASAGQPGGGSGGSPGGTPRRASGPARRPGGRSAEVRRRVLDAVREHLVEYGYDALGIDAVAERSGVHRTTVYRRWRDVGGLLADVLAEATGDDWRPPDTGSLEGDLRALNTEVYAGLTAEPPLTTALIAASFRSAPAAAALRSFWVDRYDRCAVVVDRAVRRAEIPAGADPRRLLVAATAPLYHELVLLRSAAAEQLAAEAARTAVLAARAGAFTQRDVDGVETGAG